MLSLMQQMVLWAGKFLNETPWAGHSVSLRSSQPRGGCWGAEGRGHTVGKN